MTQRDIDREHAAVHEKEDEEFDDGEEDDEDDRIKSQFDKIINHLTSGKRDLLEVVKEYDSYLYAKTTDRDCLLHMVAGRNKSSIDSLKRLVDHLIEHEPNLMRQRDADGKTPLQLAIKNRLVGLVDNMCNAVNTKMDIDSIMSIPDSRGNSCLHNAMRSKRKDARQIADKLIDRVNDKVLLTETNQDGHTPLHITVEYERCTKQQLRMVRKLIETCGKALDVNVLPKHPNQLSVYRYHEETRQQYLARQSNGEGKADEDKGKGRREQHAQRSSRDSRSAPIPPAGNKSTVRSNPAIGKKPDKGSAPLPDSPVSQVKMSQVHSGGKPIHGESQFPRMDKPGSASPCALESSTHMTSLEAEQKENKEKKKGIEGVTEESAHDIRDLLKLSFMRTREGHEEMVSFLYGPNQGNYTLLPEPL